MKLSPAPHLMAMRSNLSLIASYVAYKYIIAQNDTQLATPIRLDAAGDQTYAFCQPRNQGLSFPIHRISGAYIDYSYARS